MSCCLVFGEVLHVLQVAEEWGMEHVAKVGDEQDTWVIQRQGWPYSTW